MKDTEISINGKRVAEYDLVPPVPVNSDNIDKVLYEPLNELYGVTDDISEKLSKMLNFMDVEIKSGTIAYRANGIVKEGNYGVKMLDSISGGFQRILLEYTSTVYSEKAKYLLEVTVNGSPVSTTFVYKNKQSFIVKENDGRTFEVRPNGVDLTNASFSHGDKMTITLIYQSDCKVPVLLENDISGNDLGILNPIDDIKLIKGNNLSRLRIPEMKLVTDTWVSKYVKFCLDVHSYIDIVTPEASELEGSGIRLPLRKLQYRYNDTDTTYVRCVINRLGILPDNFIIHYEGMIDGSPDGSSNEIIEFTWGEVPGTFIVESNRGNASQVHTLVKNFDKFEPNTKYVIWIRSCIVFAFKAEPNGDLSIS